MKYKILHLPTATYLYHKETENNKKPSEFNSKVDYSDLLTEYELDNPEEYMRQALWTIYFTDKRILTAEIKSWCGEKKTPYFDFGINGREFLKKEHLEIIEVEDDEI